MSQTTWAAETATWTTDTFLWANDTYSDTANLDTTTSVLKIGTANYPSGIIIGATSDIAGNGGFSLVGIADFDMSGGFTSTGNTVYISSITLSTDNGLVSVGNLPITAAITLGSSLDIPQPGTLRWDEQTETWATHTGSWGYVPSIAVPVTADLTQINLSQLHEEDAEKLAAATYALTAGATASGSIAIPVAITIANEQNVKFNINFEESITIEGVSNISSENNFLWNQIAEDTGTTWTKVADADE